MAGVLLLVAVGGGWFYLRAAKQSEDEPEHVVVKEKSPPIFLPLDNMVVNLSDPGGDRYLQLGITFKVAEAGAVENIKAHMPSIRNEILLLTSQKTTEELLQREGKQKLATEISVAVAELLGFPAAPVKRPEGERAKSRKSSPVQEVLFSSFIVQ